MPAQPMLLGPDGRPISSQQFQNKKEAPPKLGDAFGAWAGRDIEYMSLPGGGVVQFDLSKLTTEDFRNMRDHYQVNASLAVLSFMQHQSDWHIESEDKRVESLVEEQIRTNWTMLNRGMSQSNWAGYSPMALDWDNEDRNIVLDKVKDLVPEECVVKWDTVEGWAPPDAITKPKFKVYGGIKQYGSPYPIPVENSLWYPLLMENGNYYGRKLLRPAFQSYFFSILIHLFANRYYERFGEPTPIGRAPFDDDVMVDQKSIPGNEYMLEILKNLRNRGVIVLPNDKTPYGNETNPDFDYDLEYLESQMRGADFERYLTRLDEEISIGLFTPILLLRTADVGSYSLGVGHMQMYLWMLNAMNDDRKQYIDKYIIRKMVGYNFGPNAAKARIVFRKLGNSNGEMVKELLTALTQQNKIKFDYKELGQMAGMTIEQVDQTTAPVPAPAVPDPAEDPATDTARPGAVTIAAPAGSPQDTATAIVHRVRTQVEMAFKNGGIKPDTKINMGFKRRMEKSFFESGTDDPKRAVDSVFSAMDTQLETVKQFGSEFETSDEFMSWFENMLMSLVSQSLR